MRFGDRRRRPRPRTWFADAFSRFAEEVVDNFVEDVFDQPDPAETPEPPYFQLAETCSRCRLQIYESANGVVLCLACWTRVDRPRPKPPQARRGLRQGPTRAYKVPKAAPPRPPRRWLPPEVTAALTVLGVADPSTEETIRRRRRELAFLHHPDRGGDVSKLIAVNKAADVLLDFYVVR